MVLADDGTGDLDVDAGRVAGICVRGGRPRGLPFGLPRVTLVGGAALVEPLGRPLGLPRGRPLDLSPLPALGRCAKLLLLLSSFFIGRYLSAGGVDPEGIGDKGLWGMNGTSVSSRDDWVDTCVVCLWLCRLKLLRKSVKLGFDSSGAESAIKEPRLIPVSVASGGGADGRGCVDKSLGDSKSFSGRIPPSLSKKRGGSVKSRSDGENGGFNRGCSERSIKG